jgi:OmpA family
MRPLARLPWLLLGLAAATGCKPAQPAVSAAPAAAAAKYDPPDERFVFFPSSRAEVPPDGFFAIGYAAAMLDLNPTYHVLVVGHADQHGKIDANHDLAFRRARAVRKVLMDNGVKEARILIAVPRDESESTMASLSRRADLFVYDPVQDEASKRLGYAVEIKSE